MDGPHGLRGAIRQLGLFWGEQVGILKGSSLRNIGFVKKVSRLIIILKKIFNGLLDLWLLDSGRNHWLRRSYCRLLDQLGIHGWESNGSRLVEVPHWASWLTLLN